MKNPSTSLPRVVLDTDTFNEVDDQFALAHLLLSPGEVDLEAVHAAPFHNNRSGGPGDGMEKSYEEILRVLELVGRAPSGGVFRGSHAFMTEARRPVESEAARDLVARAMAPLDRPLQVCAIGAITNVASALLLEPAIAKRITVIWLGGHAPYWPHNREFNLAQDPHAARAVMDSGVPFIQIPAFPVASHIITTVSELETHLAPRSKLGRYLSDIVRDYEGNPPAWSKIIWDISASAYVIGLPGFNTVELPRPFLQEDLTWRHDPTRPPMRCVQQLDRDAIFRDFFAKAATRG